jgi:hypothetical protein
MLSRKQRSDGHNAVELESIWRTAQSDIRISFGQQRHATAVITKGISRPFSRRSKIEFAIGRGACQCYERLEAGVAPKAVYSTMPPRRRNAQPGKLSLEAKANGDVVTRARDADNDSAHVACRRGLMAQKADADHGRASWFWRYRFGMLAHTTPGLTKKGDLRVG